MEVYIAFSRLSSSGRDGRRKTLSRSTRCSDFVWESEYIEKNCRLRCPLWPFGVEEQGKKQSWNSHRLKGWGRQQRWGNLHPVAAYHPRLAAAKLLGLLVECVRRREGLLPFPVVLLKTMVVALEKVIAMLSFQGAFWKIARASSVSASASDLARHWQGRS